MGSPAPSAGATERMGKFRLSGELGHGAIGTVGLDEDADLGPYLAIKFLQSPSSDAAEQLLEEARITAKLDVDSETAEATRTGKPHQTRLDPAVAHPPRAHQP